MIKIKYWTSLLLTLLQIVKDGLVTFYKKTVMTFTWIIKNGKTPLVTTLEMIVYWFIMTLFGIIFILMMVLFVIMDNIQDCYAYLFKKERVSRPSLCLTTFCRLVRIGINRLPRKLYGLKSHLRWPE